MKLGVVRGRNGDVSQRRDATVFRYFARIYDSNKVPYLRHIVDPDSEDMAIIEGDIRLPPVESASASNEYSNAVRQKFRLWPGGVVPYVIDNNIGKKKKNENKTFFPLLTVLMPVSLSIYKMSASPHQQTNEWCRICNAQFGNLFKYIFFILLFTSSLPCRKDQFAVSYFSSLSI